MNKIILCFTALCCFALHISATEIWKDSSKSFEVRTEDLLGKLTPEEKVQLMRYDSPAINRLGIKAYNWWNECLHGVARSGQATVFPQAIGMAAMWDRQQMLGIATTIADEARAKYNDYQKQGKYGIYKGLTFWTPNINIFRDPRWGRGMETYGEDPYLTAEMAIPFIKGLQGDDPRYLKLVATVKHFAVHSGPESTRHSADIWPSDYDLQETYLPHFERTVKEGGAYSVMCAYQRLRGAPCCGSKYLESLLRDQWNFSGYIVSDCWAIRDFYEEKAHAIVATPEEAAAMAVQAGTDLNCGSVYAGSLLKALKQGLVTEDEINVSVRRLLMARMKLGEFDPQEIVPFNDIPLSVVESNKHRQMALESARKSMVLLKNENNTLPFSKKVKRVAVIGPNADNPEVLLGNYHGFSKNMVTPLEGIRQKLPRANVQYAPGCRLAAGLPLLTPIESDYFFIDKSLKTKGLIGSYYSKSDFKGEIVHKRIDRNINFVWWSEAPFPDMNRASFSVRWEGVLVPPVSGKYAIGGEAFNGFDIYLDGKKVVVGRKSEHDPRREYSFVELEAGKSYAIRFDYLQNDTEYAVARLVWDKPNEHLQQEAVALAKKSDIVILFMGLSPSLEGEEMPVKVAGFHQGDRLNIQLPEVQTALMKEIHKIGKPTVLVLLNGSALAFNFEAENIPAILEAWYPGQSGGTAIADILFGDYNPAGRLPVTFYQSIDQIPAFDEYDMQGKTYRYFNGKALYEFGYGLSYSSFVYSLNEMPATVKAGEPVKISVNLKNTGKMAGDEVVQLYVSLPDSKYRKEIRSLLGFQRIHLKPGELKTLEFELKPEQWAALNQDKVRVNETGRMIISVGGKQPDSESINSGKVVQNEIRILLDN